MDVTDTKQTENLYQTVFENTGTAMAILEDFSTVTHVNEEMERLLGYTEGEIIGENSIRLLTKQSQEKLKEGEHVQCKNPESVPNQFGFAFTRKNGEKRDVALRTAKIPGTTKSILSLQDITAQKKWEETLSKSEERYRTLAKNLPGIVYRVFMQEGKRMEYYNDMLPVLTGYTSNELETQTINSLDSLIHPDDKQKVDTAV
jgi:PAS domain S-box-containing protein